MIKMYRISQYYLSANNAFNNKSNFLVAFKTNYKSLPQVDVHKGP